MDRFAFKIDNALKANLCKICRLCGVDHPFMVPILSNDKKGVINTNEPDLYQKIFELIGFTIHRNDCMPQRACAPCVDKINDFFDFREMCYTTEAQTRKLMGLKCDGLNKDIENVLVKRGRKRKAEEIIIEKPEVSQPSSKKGKFKDNKTAKKLPFSCNICTLEFDNEKKLKVHLIIKHDPLIPRYFCYACDHVLNLPIDVKNHDIWHKVTKSPLICGFCDAKLNNRSAFNKHVRTFHGKLDLPASKLVLDYVCPGCKEVYLTPFLFNMHKCALQTSQCGGCNQVFRQQLEMHRHIPKCAKAYKIYAMNIPIVEVKPQVDEGIRIKNEADPGEVETRKYNKKAASSDNFKRVDDLLRVTMNTLESIKQEPDSHMENNSNSRWPSENFNSESQFQDDDDDNIDEGDGDNMSNYQQMPNEPIVQLSEGTSEVNCNRGTEVNELPIPRLKIKKEHGTLNSSVIMNDNIVGMTDNSHKQIEPNESHKQTNTDGEGLLSIKQERLDEEQGVWNNIASGGDSEGMGLSSIRISSVTSGIEFNSEEQDIKPNIAELHESLNAHKRSSISCGRRRVVVKTEPIDRHTLPRITSITAGVNIPEFNIKTEIKSEPQYEGYENHTENWEETVWQQPENVTIKQERVSIKQEFSNQQRNKRNDEDSSCSNTNPKTRVDEEADINEIDDREVILLDSPPPVINLEPDMEVINLDSPDPVRHEDTNMEETSLYSPFVPMNVENTEKNHIEEINESDKSITNGTQIEVGCPDNASATDEVDNPEPLANENKLNKINVAETLETGEENDKIDFAEPLENEEESDKVDHAGHLKNNEKVPFGKENKTEQDMNHVHSNEIEMENEKDDAETFENENKFGKDDELSEAEVLENKGEIVQKQSQLSNLALPFQDSNDLLDEENNLIEEQQNELNTQRDIELAGEQEISKKDTEEVENVLNESVDPASHFTPLQNVNACSSSRSSSNNSSSNSYISHNINTSNSASMFTNNQVLFDNDNINEIAENNNNANIERELLEVDKQPD